MASGKAVLAIIRAARPQFRSAHDRVAFALHASLLAEGYSLTAVGSAASSDSPPSGWFFLIFD
jgi:proteasome inhibitor subunit 1 (PI31)